MPSSTSTVIPTSQFAPKRELKFKNREKKPPAPEPKPTKQPKPMRSIGRVDFFKFIIFFLSKSKATQITLLVFLIFIVLNEVFIFRFNLTREFFEKSPSTLAGSKVIVWMILYLISNFLALVVRPYYADHIGAILQFYFFQKTSFDLTKHKKDPMRVKYSADAYSIANRHKKCLECASVTILFDIPVNIYGVALIPRIILSKIRESTESGREQQSNGNIKVYFVIYAVLLLISLLSVVFLISQIYILLNKKICRNHMVYLRDIDSMLKMKPHIYQNWTNDNMHIAYNNPAIFTKSFIKFIGSILTKGVIFMMVYFTLFSFKTVYKELIGEIIAITIPIDTLVWSVIQYEDSRGGIYDKELQMYMKL